jgi:hypothetical protein
MHEAGECTHDRVMALDRLLIPWQSATPTSAHALAVAHRLRVPFSLWRLLHGPFDFVAHTGYARRKARGHSLYSALGRRPLHDFWQGGASRRLQHAPSQPGDVWELEIRGTGDTHVAGGADRAALRLGVKQRRPR